MVTHARLGAVAFAGDMMRFTPLANGFKSGQLKNVTWLFQLIGTLPLWREAGVRVSQPAPDAALADLRRSPAAWQAYGANPEDAWAQTYEHLAHPEFAVHLDELANHDLVIGFELPPAIKRHLHRRSVPYVSLCVHPLRFLRDLVLGATTNSPTLAASLQAVVVSESEVAAQVRRFKALFAKHWLEAFALPDGVPLLAGQTERDSVLIRGGRFADWPDCADAAAEILAPYPEVVLLKHPLRPSSASIAGFLRNRLGKTVISTNVNAYAALFSPRPAPLLATLASSLGVEARAAGLEVRFLLDDPRHKLSVPGVDVEDMVMVGHGVLTPEFWRDVVAGKPHVPPSGIEPFFYGDHYLRDTMGAWAYGALRTGLHEQPVRKVLLPALGLGDARRAELLAALAGAAPGTAMTAEAAAAAGVELVVAAPPTQPLRPGASVMVELNGDTAHQHLVQGFHAPEAWGCWSRDLRCTVELPVAPEAHGCELDLVLPIRAFEGQPDHAPVLRVMSAGQTLAYVFFRPHGPKPVDLRVRLTARAPATRIELEISRRASSAVLGTDDNRWLGFALTRMTVTCQPEPPLDRTRLADAATNPEQPENLPRVWLWGITPEPLPLLPRGEPAARGLQP